MTYTWADEATKRIKHTRTTEEIETFTLDDLKAERATLVSRQEALDRDWADFKAKVEAIETGLKVAASELPSTEAVTK